MREGHWMVSGDDTQRSIDVSQLVDAPAERIFAFLAQPANHVMFDTSGMIRGAATRSPITHVGQVFVMDMHNDMKGDHQVENHVVICQPGRAIGWAPAEPGQSPAGHTWTWRLTPVGPGRTGVSLTTTGPASRTPTCSTASPWSISPDCSRRSTAWPTRWPPGPRSHEASAGSLDAQPGRTAPEPFERCTSTSAPNTTATPAWVRKQVRAIRPSGASAGNPACSRGRTAAGWSPPQAPPRASRPLHRVGPSAGSRHAADRSR